MVKARQETLIDVQQDALGMEATAYLRLIEEQDRLKEKVQNAGECLISNMREADRHSIIIDGHVITVKYIEAKEKIKVD